MLSRVRNRLRKASIWPIVPKNWTGKLSLPVKRLLSREAVVPTGQCAANWKNYYDGLKVSPNAGAKVIIASYERLADLYRHLLSKYPNMSTYSERMNDINEAYNVLSDHTRRAAYDRIFKAKCGSQEAEVQKSTKEELVDVMQLLNKQVSKWRKGKGWRVQGWSKVARRVILIGAISLLLAILVTIGGSSFAIAQPEPAMAKPFRGPAATALKASCEAIGLIEHISGVVARYEHNIVQTSVQSMRMIEGLRDIPIVTVPTNDMACFPSPEHPLFPKYLDRRYSQFSYMVDNDGIVGIHTSGATTDSFLEKIKHLLNQLGEEE